MRNDEIQMSRTRCTNHTLESMNKKKQGGEPTKIIKTEERLEKYVATAGVECVVGKDEVG